MNSSIFQFALLPLSSIENSVNWLIDDKSINYTTVDIIDFSDELLNKVFTLYKQTYEAFVKSGQPQLITKPESLFEYNRWILIYDDANTEKEILTFLLFKTTSYGLKIGLTGSNGSNQGKKTVVSFNIKSFNSKGCYGEISGKLEKAIIDKVPIVDFHIAKEILNQLGKTDVKQEVGNHYSRVIGNLGRLIKIMVGIPLYTNSE